MTKRAQPVHSHLRCKFAVRTHTWYKYYEHEALLKLHTLFTEITRGKRVVLPTDLSVKRAHNNNNNY